MILINEKVGLIAALTRLFYLKDEAKVSRINGWLPMGQMCPEVMFRTLELQPPPEVEKEVEETGEYPLEYLQCEVEKWAAKQSYPGILTFDAYTPASGSWKSELDWTPLGDLPTEVE